MKVAGHPPVITVVCTPLTTVRITSTVLSCVQYEYRIAQRAPGSVKLCCTTAQGAFGSVIY